MVRPKRLFRKPRVSWRQFEGFMKRYRRRWAFVMERRPTRQQVFAAAVRCVWDAIGPRVA